MEELISQALKGGKGNRQEKVKELQAIGSGEVFNSASRLCRSGDWTERKLGAEILGQLGLPSKYAFLQESLTELIDLCEREKVPSVLSAIAQALGSRGQLQALPCLLRLHDHPDCQVRWSVASSLPFVMGEEIVQEGLDVLVRLSEDPDSDVRDMATFGLGTQLDVDSPRVREALIDRLDDDNFDARCEALYGLALRGDERVVPALKKELDSGRVGKLAVRAAQAIGDPRLHDSLKSLREWWDVEPELLEQAIEKTTPGNHSG